MPTDELIRLPELTRQEYETLLLMQGMATGAAFRDYNNHLALAFLRLTNKLNANNPDFIAYEVPPERTDGNHQS